MNADLKAPLIEYFAIHGLHGYKDLSIDFAGRATIVVAENGSGKTTVLNALNSFLCTRFQRLASLDFESIECRFTDNDRPLIIYKSQIALTKDEALTSRIRELTKQSDVSQDSLFDFLQNSYETNAFERFQNHPIVRQIYSSSPLSYSEIESALDSLSSEIDHSFSDDIKEIALAVRRRIADQSIETAYLPTYRRIERPLARSRGRRVSKHFFRAADQSLTSYDDMAFGLTDVLERLTEISEQVERRSNFGYRALSTQILEELLRGQATELDIPTSELPDIDSLSRFLSRVGQIENSTDNVFLGIGRLYESNEIGDRQNWYLRYFLSRLRHVIEQTREMESKVERFVDVCNGYLALQTDNKKLNFDAQTLRVVVHDEWTGRQISLEDLSSGEKQVVSLMARFYLTDTPRIVLIDEPELSLSIDWQRKVLPDIISSKMVPQLIAITHSPFVFENELDNFARPLVIKKSQVAR